MRDIVVTLSADIFVIFKSTRYEITKFTAHEISHKYERANLKCDIISAIHDSHIGRPSDIMVHGLIMILWYSSKITSNYEARTFVVVCTLNCVEASDQRVVYLPPCHTRKVHRPNAFFNRVLTQLDHDDGTRFRSSRARSSCGIYVGWLSAWNARGLRAKPCRRLHDGKTRAMHASGVHFTSLLNRRRVTRVYGHFSSTASH